jgi:hypothetical protein
MTAGLHAGNSAGYFALTAGPGSSGGQLSITAAGVAGIHYRSQVRRLFIFTVSYAKPSGTKLQSSYVLGVVATGVAPTSLTTLANITVAVGKVDLPPIFNPQARISVKV